MFSFFISHGHSTAMSHKGYKCHLWQLVQQSVQAFTMFQVQLFQHLYRKNYAVYFAEICTANVK